MTAAIAATSAGIPLGRREKRDESAMSEHHVGPAATAPLHVHHEVDDSGYLIRGQLAIRCGEDRSVANAGDYV